MKDMVKLRNEMKKAKPTFIRQDAHKIKRISRTGWRYPKGIHSKMRKRLKSRRALPAIGYSSPRSAKGLTREGFRPIIVRSLKDLNNIKNEIIIIAKSVGLKKRIQLLEKIKQLKLKILNIKDVDGFIKKAKESMELRKKQKKEETPKKVEKPKETSEKKETPEEKEKREKEEKRRILEKK